MTMTPEEQKAKRQAFSINIPDEKKELWAKIAKDHNRPMSWLFMEMVDRMIAAGSIHIYKDSEIIPSGDIPPGALTEYVSRSDMSEILKGYIQSDEARSIADSAIEQALNPIHQDMAELLSQILELRRPDGDSFGTKPKGKAIAPSGKGYEDFDRGTQLAIDRLRANPDLLAAVAKGAIERGLTGDNLGAFLSAKGFNNNAGKPFDRVASSRFTSAAKFLAEEA
jgi:hypothetical protein